MISKVIEGHKSSSDFSVNPTLPLLDYPLMLPSQIECISLSLFPSLSPTLSPTLSLSIPPYLPLLLHMRTFLCRVIFNDFQIFLSNYNLDLLRT